MSKKGIITIVAAVLIVAIAAVVLRFTICNKAGKIDPKPTDVPAVTDGTEVTADPNATTDPDATPDPDATTDPDATQDPDATPDPDASQDPEGAGAISDGGDIIIVVPSGQDHGGL